LAQGLELTYESWIFNGYGSCVSVTFLREVGIVLQEMLEVAPVIKSLKSDTVEVGIAIPP